MPSTFVCIGKRLYIAPAYPLNVQVTKRLNRAFENFSALFCWAGNTTDTTKVFSENIQ
jgi:hypothetical protein